MSHVSPLLADYLEHVALPFNVWLAPHAQRQLSSHLAGRIGAGARVYHDILSGNVDLKGPAILLLVPADLRSAERDALFDVGRLALPGRPVLVGGTADRDILLSAINDWRIYRVVPDHTPPEVIVDALEKAWQAMRMAISLERAGRELRTETDQLVRVVDDLRAAQDRLLHAERLTTMGRMTGGLIKAMHQHLTALDGFERLAASLCREPEISELLTYAQEGVQSIAVLLDEIHAFAEDRPQAYAFAPEPLDELVGRALTFSRFDQLSRKRVLKQDLASGARIHADRHRLYHVLLNLLRNAFQATEPGDTVSVRTRNEGANALVDIEDTGAGMPAEIRDRIFEPFFSTKGDQGMGLGLRVARMAVERHGATINVRSEPGKGTTFTLSFPRLPDT